ncbi:MAG: hypothetical protein QM682_12480 [Paracoccus sp. (in: a-proteobacteria)]|uniref:hypothetical protein n=1 Tax=Paracoccus sp. TaxID=267 RepID=UPI0039E4FCA4
MFLLDAAITFFLGLWLGARYRTRRKARPAPPPHEWAAYGQRRMDRLGSGLHRPGAATRDGYPPSGTFADMDLSPGRIYLQSRP